MYIKKLAIRNFRLLKNTNISLTSTKTLFVGRNNTGKTSVMSALNLIANGTKRLKFEDYPLSCRRILYEQIEQYFLVEISMEGLCQNIDKTSFIIDIDYENVEEDESLGRLSNFIIDLDENISLAKIKCIYEVSTNLEIILENLKEQYNELILETDPSLVVQQLVKENFHLFFELKIFALNPTDLNDTQLRNVEDIKALFALRKISAERNLGEVQESEQQGNPLASILSSLFNTELAQAETDIQPVISGLKKVISTTKYALQDNISDHMNDIVESMMQFGYPSGEDLKLKANSDLDIENSIISGTQLTYVSHDDLEALPGTHNGLGYKNLIKISLILQDYIRNLKNDETKIPLLFIEEPEAHMHPQLQTTFISYLENFLKDKAKHSIQTIVTTHSSHVANAVPFEQVRYFRKHADNIECKNLIDFKHDEARSDEDERKENIDFLQKYIKLSHCDLYFCDKAILVEGASERLLIADVINKCYQRGLFSEDRPSLQSQYYTIIEVGGAYAFRFFDFLNFLEIPTLVITDIDYINSKGKSCQKEESVRSSNGTINRWCRSVYGMADKNVVTIEKILEMAKTEHLLIDKKIRLAYQGEEDNMFPRSFEEAILNVNRNMYGINDEEVNLEFDSSQLSKTDFAIRMLVDENYSNYAIPSYIEEGLVWLSSQKKDL